ncbi:helix-turn-helix transcriptional regulator [Chryseobacterium sp. Tr-659]|uniref:helix-turn-helix domain-containing protein n=1 Tax=Chryseobacterium sp. Tr-659 TaxID=2608340 RepID=UPI00141FFCDD|nr:AraC family transcriptional regulator [Chryseobacterium sp. Tr-659]NIF04369.1 helix-turn-helix transcriptional regulator [Chryseobacterium sp. Tr-659]
MSANFNIFDTIVIVGILQGIAAAIAVYFYPSGTPGKKLLSTILVTLALLSFKILLHTLQLWQNPDIRYFPLAVDTLIQPLFYLYVCSLTDKDFSFNRKQFRHFIPAILFQLHAMVVYTAALSQPSLPTKDLIAENYFHYNSIKWIEDVFALFSAGIYWYFSFRRIQIYRKWLFTSQSATQYSELTWLRNLLIGTGILVIVLLLSSLYANILQLQHSFLYLEIFYVYLTLLIYFLSFQGYKSLLTSEVQVLRLSDHESSSAQIELIDSDDQEIKTTGNDELFSTIGSALKEVMDKQLLFMEPELNIKEVAAAVHFPSAQVSAAINAKFGVNFRSWVNSYRIEEVKKRLNDPAFRHLSITGIAFDCGFNSEASFYRIFRNQTGYSPKTYLQNLKK